MLREIKGGPVHGAESALMLLLLLLPGRVASACPAPHLHDVAARVLDAGLHL